MKFPTGTPIRMSVFNTSEGTGAVVGGDGGLLAVFLPGDENLAAFTSRIGEGAEEDALTKSAAKLLERYYRGEPVELLLPYDDRHFTPFQRKVYAFVSRMPYGSVLTYGDVAAAVGKPWGARGVGGAMAANPLPILIPCHRVVGCAGALTGYSATGGVETKKRLLAMEGVRLDERGRAVLECSQKRRDYAQMGRKGVEKVDPVPLSGEPNYL